MSYVAALLAASLLAGVLARHSHRFPPESAQALNAFALCVALPALVLRSVHRLQWHPSLLAAAAAPWLTFAGAWLLFGRLHARLGLTPRPAAALVLTAGLCNTAFVGLPLLEALLGPAALPVAVVVDQFGSFLVLSTVATAFAAHAAARTAGSRALLRQLLTFPPFIALLLAVATRAWGWPVWLESTLQRLGDTLTPLALFSVGYQLRMGRVHVHARALSLGLGYKLLLAPLGVALALRAVPGLPPLVYEVSVLQVAMSPMVSAALLAAEHELEPELAALMVGVGIPLSFATVPLWRWVLERGGPW
jgi:malate permease and related proteins